MKEIIFINKLDKHLIQYLSRYKIKSQSIYSFRFSSTTINNLSYHDLCARCYLF